MKTLLRLALRSAWNRRLTLGLTLAAVALSSLLLLGVERLRADLRENFAMSVSGVDLVVGARGSPVQLLLYSVFRMGEVTQNMGWASASSGWRSCPAWPGRCRCPWAIRTAAFRCSATSPALLRPLPLWRPAAAAAARASASRTPGLFETVLGAEVAERLGYPLGAKITLAHGSGEGPGADHGDKPFVVTGILRTHRHAGGPHAAHQPGGMEALHLEWVGGVPMPGLGLGRAGTRKPT